MTVTMNGTASRCTCTNPRDRCPACRAFQAAKAKAKANPPAVESVPAASPTPKPHKPRLAVEPPTGDGERWLTPTQAAAMLAVGIRTLWRMAAAGIIPKPYRFTAKLVRFDYQALVQFIKKMRDDAAQPPPAA